MVRPLGTLLAMLIVAWLGLPRSIDGLILDVPVEATTSGDAVSERPDQSAPGLTDLEETSMTHVWREASAPLERRATSLARQSFTPQHTPPVVLPPPKQN